MQPVTVLAHLFSEMLAIFPPCRLFTSGSVLKRTNCYHPDSSLQTVPYLWVVDVSRPDKWCRARSALRRQHPQLRRDYGSTFCHIPGISSPVDDFTISAAAYRLTCYLWTVGQIFRPIWRRGPASHKLARSQRYYVGLGALIVGGGVWHKYNINLRWQGFFMFLIIFSRKWAMLGIICLQLLRGRPSASL